MEEGVALAMQFQKNLGAPEIQAIRAQVQKECASIGLDPQRAFTVLFVTDELACNVMEHAHASKVEISIDAAKDHFALTLKDDGVPFDSGEGIEGLAKGALVEKGERNLGLSLIGRLVDKVSYQRLEGGSNELKVEKSW